MFNSFSSLAFIQESIEKTFLAEDPVSEDMVDEHRRPFQGLPVVIVLAHNAQLTDSELLKLREDGPALADRYATVT